MLKKIYLAALFVVTVICVVVGIAIHSYYLGIGKVIENDDPAQEVQAQDLEAFARIQVEAALMDLTICRGDKYHISVEAGKELQPAITVSGGMLTIKQRKIPQYLNHKSKECSVTLTIPKAAKLEAAEITVNVGDIDWEKVACDVITADTNVGDIDLSQADMKELGLTSDVGDLSMEGCSLGKGVCKTNVGDVDLEEVVFEQLETSTNTGDVNLEGGRSLQDCTMELSTNTGELAVNDRDYKKVYHQDGTKGTFTAETSVGDINVEY